MIYDSVPEQEMVMPEPVTALVKQALHASVQQADAHAVSKRGRPARLSEQHLGWAVIWCLLMGSPIQLEIWRTIQMGFACFAPLILSNQAIYKRMSQCGIQAVQSLLIQVSGWLATQLVWMQDKPLAPFASDVLALDESTLDHMGRWLPGLREVPAGDPSLLAGRLSCLYDLRKEQWRRVDVLSQAQVDSKVHANAMRLGLRAGTLLLCDLGYFSFEWFDDLTRLGHFWISRMRKRTSSEIIHILAEQDGYLDALVWLGSYRADRAAFAVRLIQVRHHGQWYRYLTNVLDPTRLSGAEVVRLYARRWDIEVAFRTLKDHLDLRRIWSAKWEMIVCQILTMVLLANVFQVTQRQLAHQAGVEVGDVSMDLLVRYVPRVLQRGLDPISTLLRQGRSIGLIRPSTRRRFVVPELDWRQVLWPPYDLVLERTARYAHNPGGHARKKKDSQQ